MFGAFEDVEHLETWNSTETDILWEYKTCRSTGLLNGKSEHHCKPLFGETRSNTLDIGGKRAK